MNILINTDNGDTIYLLPLFKTIYEKHGKAGLYFCKSAESATTHFSLKKNLFYDLLFEQSYITSFGFVPEDLSDPGVFCGSTWKGSSSSVQEFFNKIPSSTKMDDDKGLAFNNHNYIDFMPNLFWTNDNNINLYPLSYLVTERFNMGHSFKIGRAHV